MNKEKSERPFFLRRVGAYLIDLILVAMLASVISMLFFNNQADQTQAEQLVSITDLTSRYNEEKITKDDYVKELDTLVETISKEEHSQSIDEAIDITKQYASDIIGKEEYDTKMDALSQKLNDEGVPLASVRLLYLMNKLKNGEITNDEYNKEAEILNYYVTKNNIPTTTAFCAVGLIYYVVMCFFCHGITLGKFIMKLQIVSANEKELNIGHFLIRALFADLLLSYLFSVIFVLTMNIDVFTKVYPKVSSGLIIFILVSMLFIVYREDGRGLHDLIANTKVISTKTPKVKVGNEIQEVVEAKVIEEKKTIEEENKKTTKKKTTKKSTKKEVKK